MRGEPNFVNGTHPISRFFWIVWIFCQSIVPLSCFFFSIFFSEMKYFRRYRNNYYVWLTNMWIYELNVLSVDRCTLFTIVCDVLTHFSKNYRENRWQKLFEHHRVNHLTNIPFQLCVQHYHSGHAVCLRGDKNQLQAIMIINS